MNLLGSRLMIPIAIAEKTFTPPLAFITQRFAVLFNYVPLTVTDCTNHFSLPVSTIYDASKGVVLTDLAYTLFVSGWQEKIDQSSMIIDCNVLVTAMVKNKGNFKPQATPPPSYMLDLQQPPIY